MTALTPISASPPVATNLSALTVSVLTRELRLALRRWDQLLQPLLFFVLITMLFPLALGADQTALRRVGPGVVWVSAVLASLLALESLFRSDVEDGTMEQWVLSPQPLAWLLFVKTMGHWLITGVPLVLVSPLMATGFGIENDALPTVMGSLALGTGVLSMLGAIGAALTVSIRRGNVLIALVVLPLQVPVLVFGAHAISLAMQGENVAGPMYLLASMLLGALGLGPLALAAAMRISVES